MEGYYQTKRNYTDLSTGETYAMWHNSSTGDNVLMREGKVLKRFVLSAFTPTDYRMKNGEIIRCSVGEFINCENEMPTHKKFFIEKRFKKL